MLHYFSFIYVAFWQENMILIFLWEIDFFFFFLRENIIFDARKHDFVILVGKSFFFFFAILVEKKLDFAILAKNIILCFCRENMICDFGENMIYCFNKKLNLTVGEKTCLDLVI